MEDENLEMENVEQIEETSASDTLKPGPSKAAMVSTFVQLMNSLGREDLTKFYNDSVANISKISDGVPSGAHSKNLASITVKEDIDELFSGEELTEDFKTKASTLFEAAVNAAASVEVARLQEEFEESVVKLDEEYKQKLEEEIEAISEELEEKLDSYLDHVVESFMTENEIAIEHSIKNQISEEFMEGLKNLFETHYITIPEEKVDVVEEMTAEIESLKNELNETTEKNIELSKQIEESVKQNMIKESVEGMIDTQAEKFKLLAESVEFSSVEEFEGKLAVIKESFSNKPAPKAKTGLIVEDIDGEAEVTNDTPSRMDIYTRTISRISN